MSNDRKGFDWSDPDISRFGPNTTPEERDSYKKNTPPSGFLSTVFIIILAVVFILNCFSSCVK